MHRVLLSQIERARQADGAVDFEKFCASVEATYRQFDVQRVRTERENVLMTAELEEVNARLAESFAQIRREHEDLETALDSMAHGLAMFDANNKLRICNKHYRRALGLSVRYEGHDFFDILKQVARLTAESDGPIAEVPALMAKGKAAERIVRLQNGAILSVSFAPRSGGGWVEVHRDVTAQHLANEQIRYLAHHDSLTGLSNRAVFHDDIAADLALLKAGQGLTVFCLDLDRFKPVNDALGHPVGDILLQQVAERLREATPGARAVGRLGGDEFAVLWPDAGDIGVMERRADKIVNMLSAPYQISGATITIGVSIGVASAPQDGATAEDILRNADIALYRAKNEGRGGFRFFEPGLDQAMQGRRKFEIDLRNALEANELELFYQPLVDLKQRRIHAFEALLRWRRNGKMVPPDEFIPVAEEIGAIGDIGAWVLREACKQASEWPEFIGVAVNVSPLQLETDKIIDDVREALRLSGLAPERLELEITESSLLKDTDRTLEILHALRGLGLRIAMDDFGTGYSSLSYLRRFPFDKLKIDRSFIRDIAENQEAGAIVRAIIQVASTLGMTTTAEGVETGDQKDFLRALNCSEAQGFFISRPVPAADIEELLPSQESRDVA